MSFNSKHSKHGDLFEIVVHFEGTSHSQFKNWKGFDSYLRNHILAPILALWILYLVVVSAILGYMRFLVSCNKIIVWSVKLLNLTLVGWVAHSLGAQCSFTILLPFVWLVLALLHNHLAIDWFWLKFLSIAIDSLQKNVAVFFSFPSKKKKKKKGVV